MNIVRNLWPRLMVLVLLLALSTLACNLNNQMNAPTATPPPTAITNRPQVDIARGHRDCGSGGV